MISDYFGLKVLNFPFGLIVSLIIFLGIAQINQLILNRYKNLFFKPVNIILPFVIFSIYFSIINVLLYTNVLYAKNFVFISIIFFLYFSYLFIKKNNFKNFINKNFRINFIDIFIFIYLITYLIISSLPISDADSLSYHSSFGAYVIKYSNVNWMKNLELIHPDLLLSGATEIINFIGLTLFVENFGSYVNFLSLIYIYIILQIFFKKNKNVNLIFLIIISSPIILPMVFSQKIYILPSLILSTIIFILFKKKKFNNVDFILIFSSLMIVSSYKISFLIPVLFILLYLMYLSLMQKKLIINILFSFLSLSFFLFPLILKNLYFHSDFFPPLTGQILNLNSTELNNFANFIKQYDLMLNKNSIIFLPFLIFLPHYGQLGNVYFSLPNIGKIYGLQFYSFLFADKNLGRNFLFLILFFIFCIFLTGNISTRWFLYVFFLLQFGFLFFNLKINNIFLLLIKMQIAIFGLFLVFYSLLNIEALLNNNKKKEFLINNSNGFDYVSKINSISKKLNINKNNYILYSHRSHFWTDVEDNHLNYGSEWAQLFEFDDKKIFINTKFKKLVEQKPVKLIIIKKNKNLVNLLKNSFNRNCEIDHGSFSSPYSTRNIFFSGKKEYNWIFFKNENFISCLKNNE